eukprot:scaffold289445_cov33-Prasinocladus_malaysianus.AAC.1
MERNGLECSGIFTETVHLRARQGLQVLACHAGVPLPTYVRDEFISLSFHFISFHVSRRWVASQALARENAAL